ncbi:response regulator [Pseudonocardia alni]|uniref:response regulator transcription factor n=1 Tax=Pseudonocardia alni TaxID=33907 RepID=UPI0027A535CD|nr:response regulator transcription factor [Pseudonocardia alni]
MDEPVTVLLVDDHPLVRHGLAALLGTESWVGAVLQGGSVREGAALGATARPDVAVVDLGLPDGPGLELVRRLRRTPGCPVLVLTMTGDDGTVRACLAAGASGYVRKDTDPGAVVRALRTVLDGGQVLGPGVRAAPGAARVLPPFDRLSPGQLRLARLVAAGATTSAVAAELAVSDKTVRNRISELLAATGLADRVQLALRAREAGLIPPNGVA